MGGSPRQEGGSKLCNEDPRDEDGQLTWPRRRYLEMDAEFRGAMLDALEAGLEKLPEPPGRRPADRVRFISFRPQTDVGSAVGRLARPLGE